MHMIVVKRVDNFDSWLAGWNVTSLLGVFQTLKMRRTFYIIMYRNTDTKVIILLSNEAGHTLILLAL